MWRKREEREQRIGANAEVPIRRKDDDKLTEELHVRISSLDMRRIQKLFQRNRDAFAWEIKSDQYRDIIKVGIAHYEDRVKNPDEDMLSLRRMADTLDMVEGLAARHERLNRAVSYVEDEVQALLRNGDLSAIRAALAKFRDETRQTKDTVIKARRETEFDARWGRLYESLNRGASLSKFEED